MIKNHSNCMKVKTSHSEIYVSLMYVLEAFSWQREPVSGIPCQVPGAGLTCTWPCAIPTATLRYCEPTESQQIDTGRLPCVKGRFQGTSNRKCVILCQAAYKSSARTGSTFTAKLCCLLRYHPASIRSIHSSIQPLTQAPFTCIFICPFMVPFITYPYARPPSIYPSRSTHP